MLCGYVRCRAPPSFFLQAHLHSISLTQTPRHTMGVFVEFRTHEHETNLCSYQPGVAPTPRGRGCGRDRTRTTSMISDFSMWLGGKDASIYVGMSREWIEIKALEWTLDDKPVPGRIRYQWLRDKPSELGVRRYYRADLDAIRHWSADVTRRRPARSRQANAMIRL